MLGLLKHMELLTYGWITLDDTLDADCIVVVVVVVVVVVIVVIFNVNISLSRKLMIFLTKDHDISQGGSLGQ